MGSQQYTYDGIGNRLSKAADGVWDTYSYPVDSHRLAAISGANPETFSYDANGNTTQFGSAALTYGDHSRLMQATPSGQPPITYQLNGRGERVSKTISGDTTYYVFDIQGRSIGRINGLSSRAKRPVRSVLLVGQAVRRTRPRGPDSENASCGCR